MNTLQHFADKFGFNPRQNSPIEIQKINRVIMAQTLGELGFTIGAEVGVAAGDHSETLLQNIPGLTLYCIDPWVRMDGFASFSDNTLHGWHERAKEKLSKYEKCFMVQKTSMDAVRGFKDRSLDFVYIDGAHDFKNVAMDICEWIRKVREGGVLFGHDFETIAGGKYPCHVEDIVTAYANSHQLDKWFILGMKTDLRGRSVGEYREGVRSWMYIL